MRERGLCIIFSGHQPFQDPRLLHPSQPPLVSTYTRIKLRNTPTLGQISKRKEERRNGIGREKVSSSLSVVLNPYRRSFHDFQTIEFQDVLRGNRGSRSQPLRELHNESVRRERKGKIKKTSVDSLGSFEACCLFFEAADGISAWTKGNSMMMLLSFLSFICSPSLSRHVPRLPSNSSRVPISPRASYLVISIRVGAFLSRRVCILFVLSLERVSRFEGG